MTKPELIYAEAHKSGQLAVEKITVAPMIVQQHANPLDDNSDVIKQYYVADGVCGFASINVKPANSKFAKFIVQNNLGHKSIYGGVFMSIRDYNQSLQKKEAYAYAFADVLNKHGIKAYAESRMD